MNIDKNMHVPISIQIRTLKSMLIHQSELGKTRVELEGGGSFETLVLFAGDFICALLVTAFCLHFLKPC